ncbi:MAG: SH3 domain-containing protein [Caldilinea sp.]
MNPKQMILPVTLVVTTLMTAACQPITVDNMASALAGQPVTVEAPLVAVTPATTTVAAPAADLGEGAIATVTATSLRVRAQPSTSAEVVAGVREGEQYRVIGRSSDGLWLELAVPRAAGGRGWVSANFVTVSGSITDAEVVSAPTARPAPTATPADAAPTAAPAEEAAEPTATAAPAEEAAEAAPTAVATEEPTAEPVAETVEATPTAIPAEETNTVVAPEPGFALVIAEGARLRVRAEPSTEAQIVGWLQPGEIIAVEEISEDGLWVRVPGVPGTENLTGGWVLAEFLMLGQ